MHVISRARGARRWPKGRRRIAVTAAVAVLPLLAAGALAGPARGSVLTTVPSPALAATPDTSWWGTNGRVNDIAVMGGRVFLGGAFDYVGPNTGHGAVTDPGTGALQTPNNSIDGEVYASIPDGAGGWYVGGSFKKAGHFFRSNVVRINADGTVNAWDAKVTGSVYSLAIQGNNVVIGGKLTAVGGTAATNLALVNNATGARVPGWNASANSTVRALGVSGSRIYVGGLFSTVIGGSRRGFAALDATTGTTDSSFTGQVNANVYAIALDTASGRVYVGGDFTSASTSGFNTGTRNRLASFDLSGNSLNSWAPSSDGVVYALAADGAGSVFAGGAFSAIGGAARFRVASLSTTTGSLGAFTASLSGCHGTHGTKTANEFYPCTPVVNALGVTGGTLYVAGLFSQAASQVRHNAAAYSLADGSVTTWDPRPGNVVLALGAHSSGVFIGGEQASVNGQLRTGMAALNATTGALDPSFQADTDNAVLDFVPAPDGLRLFVAGSFTSIQGPARPYLVAIDVATGLVNTAFTPTLNNTVLVMDAVGSSVYLGGKFTRVSGKPRARAAKVNATTGGADPFWIANTSGPSGKLRSNGMVEGMQVAPDESKVYLGGPFTSINGTAVTGGIAVLTGTTAAFLPNRLGGVAGCGSVGPWINRLHLSEDGLRLYGGDVCPDKVYQWDAVNLSSPSKPTGLNWVTACNGGAQGLLEVNGHLYYGTHGGDRGRGGWCLSSPTGGQVAQQRFFVFSADDGTLYSYAPEFDSAMGVWAYAELPGRGLLMGGDFTFGGTRDSIARGIAFFPGTP